ARARRRPPTRPRKARARAAWGISPLEGMITVATIRQWFTEGPANSVRSLSTDWVRSLPRARGRGGEGVSLHESCCVGLPPPAPPPPRRGGAGPAADHPPRSLTLASAG